MRSANISSTKCKRVNYKQFEIYACKPKAGTIFVQPNGRKMIARQGMCVLYGIDDCYYFISKDTFIKDYTSVEYSIVDILNSDEDLDWVRVQRNSSKNAAVIAAYMSAREYTDTQISLDGVVNFTLPSDKNSNGYFMVVPLVGGMIEYRKLMVYTQEMFSCMFDMRAFPGLGIEALELKKPETIHKLSITVEKPVTKENIKQTNKDINKPKNKKATEQDTYKVLSRLFGGGKKNEKKSSSKEPTQNGKASTQNEIIRDYAEYVIARTKVRLAGLHDIGDADADNELVIDYRLKSNKYYKNGMAAEQIEDLSYRHAIGSANEEAERYFEILSKTIGLKKKLHEYERWDMKEQVLGSDISQDSYEANKVRENLPIYAKEVNTRIVEIEELLEK